jgi:hypothetical protein
MYPLRMMRQPLRLALLVTLVVVAMSACGGGGGSAQEQANKPRHLPENNATLRPGEYHSDEFKPSLSFRLGKGWSRGGPELRDIWDLRSIENDAFWVVFANAEEVWDPNGSDGLKIAPAPEDMVAWLQANPHMKSEKPKPTSIAGEKGVQFDAIVSGAAESPECPGCVDLPLFRLSDGGTTGVEKGEKIRFIVLEDVKGQTVSIFIEASTLGFEEFFSKAQQMIKTVEWKGT